MIRISFSLVLFSLLVGSGCIKEEALVHRELRQEKQSEQTPNHYAAPASQQEDAAVIQLLTVDENGNTVIPVLADPDTKLYYRRNGEPVLAPDGHHITAGEFIQATGTAIATCIDGGTQVKVHMSGLIPHAYYRIWILTFKEPGFDPSLPNPFVNITGLGALGPNDGTRNTFKASASGEGTIVRFMPEGSLSVFGAVGNCLLDEFEWHAVGAFQQPGYPVIASDGPPSVSGKAVEQFVMVFK